MADAILDTTFFIDLRKGDAGTEQLWLEVRTGSIRAAYCAVTPFELWVGADFGPEDEEFHTGALALLEEAPLTGAASARAGIWLRPLARPARERRLRDALIAATAYERAEPVYTRNLRDFSRFPIKVELY